MLVLIHCAQPAVDPENWTISAGMYSSDEAKMTGMTPAWLTFSGMYVDVPPYARGPIMRFAYCTGIRRWAGSTKTTMTNPTAITARNSTQPPAILPETLIAHSELGKLDAMATNIRIDMPLPMPRSVISSPSHMTVAVPAVMQVTMVMVVKIDWLGTIWSPLGQLENRLPERAVATRPVPCSTASATVRYRVYWVIFVVPAWPSFLRASRRGMTTVRSCRMMLAVMYGMIPSAKIVSCNSAPPLNMLTRPKRLLLPFVSAMHWLTIE